MKLILVLSLIACGYADKLDRSYLPPSSAATAGGSPGALTAPGSNTGFGQGLPNISAGSRPSFGQNGISNGPSVTGNIQGSGLGQASGSFPGTGSLGFNSNIGATQNGIQNSKTDAPTGQSFSQGSNNFGSNPQSSRTPFGQTPQSNVQAFAPAEFKPERPQAAADRNAEILKYINENNGDSYEYSYETSNGIAADESGVATNGVRAQGGYSYTGDDGKYYAITYTADENGYQPQGEHLPTPPPIPEEILKSIEDNARAAASGTQEGAYRPDEYESDSSPQQYSAGASNYNTPQRTIGSVQDQGLSPSNQGQSQQGYPTKSSFNSIPFNQRKPDQVPSKFSGATSQQGPQGQYSQGGGTTNTDSYPESSSQPKLSQKSFQGSNNVFGTPQGQSNQNLQGQNSQGPSGNGYNYNKPLTQGTNQLQQGQNQKMSQGIGSPNNGLSGLQVGQPTSQFNQPQRPLQSFNNQPVSQKGPSNQYTRGQGGQGQNGNGYNYNKPQNPTQGSNQFSGPKDQQVQPQNSSPRFGADNNAGQPTGQSASQLNQNSKNQFGNQQRPQQYSQGQNAQSQRGNGYNYNQPQNSAQGSRFPGSGSQSTSNGVFRQQPGQPTRQSSQPQQPLQGSSNVFGKQQEPSNQISQGPRGQDQRGNGYNYNQPQKPTQGTNRFPGFGTQSGQSTQPGQSTQSGQGMRINDNATPFGAQAGQPNNQFGQPQRPLQGTPSSGLRNQQGQSNQYSPNKKGQDQDENGYYYNRPQNSISSPTTQGPFGQNRPQSSTPSQAGFPSRPASNYDSNNINSNRPGQQAFSNMNQPSFAQTRPGSTNTGNINGPSIPQGTQYSSEANKPSFGSPSSNSRPGNGGNADVSRPDERYQPSLAPASKFPTQQITGQNKPSSPSFGSSSPSQSAAGQTLAQGYQYSAPGQSSNQPQRPGFNVNGNVAFNGATGVNKGSPAGSEFEGPRQPPSFSAEEGYKY